MNDTWVTNSHYAVRRPGAWGLFAGSIGEIVRSGQNGEYLEGSWNFGEPTRKLSHLDDMGSLSASHVVRLGRLTSNDNEGHALSLFVGQSFVGAVRSDWHEAIQAIMPKGYTITMESEEKPLAFWSNAGDLLALIMPVRMAGADSFASEAALILDAYQQRSLVKNAA